MVERSGWTRAALLGIAAAVVVAGAARGDDAELLRAAAPPENGVWLGSLDLSRMSQDYGEPRRDRTVDRNPLRLHGVTYPHGIGTHAQSEMLVDLKGSALRFMAMCGLDDERQGRGSITFEVRVDGKKVAE